MERTHGGELAAFFAWTFAAMWIAFFTLAATGISIGSPLGVFLVLGGAYSPAIVALALTARRRGGPGVESLLAGLLRWRVAPGWYLFALAYPPSVKLLAALGHRWVTGAWPPFGQRSWVLVVLAVALSTPFQAGEEIGWRGYALPRLVTRFGLASGSAILGLVWGAWHLPQFFVAGGDSAGRSFYLFVVQVTALGITLAWLWERTGRSLLLPMLMHASVNNATGIVASDPTGGGNPFHWSASLVSWLTAALLWIGAAACLATMPRRGPAPTTRP